MSSAPDIPHPPPVPGSKKRRLQGACDICRRKKIKCDSARMPGNRCSHCIAFDSECTHTMSDKKRAVKGPNYVEDLEARVKNLEGLVRKLDPHAAILQEYEDLDAHSPEPSQSKERSPNPSSIPRIPLPLPADASANKEIVEGDHEHVKLAESMHNLSLHRAGDRFFGKSSGFMLLHTAIKVKRDYAGQTQTEIKPVEFKRPEIWNLEPWETAAIAKDDMFDYVFPDEDLLDDLIDIFFTKINPYIPLLHRASFERFVADRLHDHDRWFASTLLTVCALASRYSDDPRVLMEPGAGTSAGWKWFSQIQVLRQSFLNIPSLFELQFYALSVIYYHGSSNPQACWIMIGLGIRYAQEVGAHRKKEKEKGPTLHGELLKRAFWLLVLMDRLVSSFVGRPCAIQDEDFDLDLPIECDDEYWEHPDPKQAFTQPLGKPCRVTAFILALKLCEVLASALRTIYSTNVNKLFAGLAAPNWEQRIVSELDSVLNKWVDSVPDSLRWDPNREDSVFFHLSANIFGMYYYTQILVHRPFITSVKGSSSLSFASLAICTNSARACCHLLDIQRRRGPLSPLPSAQLVAFTSSLVLLMNIWGAKKSRISFNPEKELEDIRKSMNVLSAYELRWRTAGRLYDMLNALMLMGDLPLPKPAPRSRKRVKDLADSDAAESPTSVPQPSNWSPDSPSSTYTPPSFASSRPGSGTFRSLHLPSSSASSAFTGTPPQQMFDFPTSSEELGRMPVYAGTDAEGITYDSSLFANWPGLVTPDFVKTTFAPQGPESNSNFDRSVQLQHQNQSFIPSVGPHPSPFNDAHPPSQAAPTVSFPEQYAPYTHEWNVDGITAAGTAPGPSQSYSTTANTANESEATNPVAFWSMLPAGFDFQQWSAYLANTGDPTQT